MPNLSAISEGLIRVAKQHRRMVMLHGDFGRKIGVEAFKSVFDDRSFNFGLAEGNLLLAAAGFALRGHLPFVVGYGNFLTRAAGFLRDNICLANLNVKMVVVDGAAMEGEGFCLSSDLGLLKSMPNLKIWTVGDEGQLVEALGLMLNDFGPCVLRVQLTERRGLGGDNKFDLSRPRLLRRGSGACVFTYGKNLAEVMDFADQHAEMDLQIVEVPVLRPFGEQAILQLGAGNRKWFVVEEQTGALAEDLALVLARTDGQKPLLQRCFDVAALGSCLV